MKKYIFIIVILICCGWVAAQSSKGSSSKESGKRRALFGVSFGPSIDWFVPTSKSLSYEKEKAGLNAGILLDMSVASKEFLYFSTGLMIRYLQGEVALLNKYPFDFNHDGVDDTISAVRTYQTTYLTIPTGIKLRMNISDKFVFLGKLGLYHNFRVGGKQFDNFSQSGEEDRYYITTKKKENEDAALFAESGYLGLGVEYVFQNSLRLFLNLDYSCQFNYFKSKAKSNVSGTRFKTVVHSMHINLGFLF